MKNNRVIVLVGSKPIVKTIYFRNEYMTTFFKNCLGVFQGGGCKAISFIGAYEEAYNRGVFFSELAGTSAGSIFASLIAAGATPEQLNNIVKKVPFSSFKKKANHDYKKFGSKRAKFFRHMSYGGLRNACSFFSFIGIYSSEEIESWLEKTLQDLLGVKDRKVLFSDLLIPLHVVATDIEKRSYKIWSSQLTASESVAKAVRCSSTIPVFFQPVDEKYVDGGLVSNLPSFILTNHNDNHDRHFEKILCFTLSSATNNKQLNYKEYIRRLISSIIDGSTNIQNTLQNNLYQINIKDIDLDTTDFEKVDNAKIDAAIDLGRHAAKTFFDNEVLHIGSENFTATLLTDNNFFNALVKTNPNLYDEVSICLGSCSLSYNLFPTLLSWSRTIKNKFLHTSNRYISEMSDDKKKHEQFRRFIIEKLGFKIIYYDKLPFEGVFFISSDSACNTALIVNQKNEEYSVPYASLYYGARDEFAIESLRRNFQSTGREEVLKNSHEIVKIDISTVFGKLRERVKQYASEGVEIRLEYVDVSNIISLTRYVKSYKYNQIKNIFELYRNERDLDLFDGIAIRFEDDCLMPITPPVFEKQGDSYILIEGNSRVTYCIKELKALKIKAIVVHGVKNPLPSSGRYKVNQMLISDTNKVGENRYQNFALGDYRWIEKAVRTPTDYISPNEEKEQ